MIRTPIRLMTALLAVAALTLAACGDTSDDTSTPAGGTRTVEIEMRDIKFSPDTVQVTAGETVRFVFKNVGAVPHDAFIGDEAAQDAHEMEMRAADGSMSSSSSSMTMDSSTTSSMEMSGGGDAAENGITVEPGDTGELTYTFSEGEELLIGCHQAGHYAAGMKLTLNVS